MTHGSLFSGIGGFDLAAEWAGWENIFHCEWNEFGQKVLEYHFPKAITHNDITKTDFTTYRDRIDVLTGGFPCQPYSAAGKRLGKEDERHLWPEMLRAIREIAPKWVVGENVLGLVNWNGGLVFQEVQSDLEAEGYEVQPYILPAAGVGAPHRRDRVWFVAHKNTDKNGRSYIEREKEPKKRGQRNIGAGVNERIPANNDKIGFVAYSDNTRADKRVRSNGNGEKENKGRQEQPQPEFRENGNNATNPDKVRLQQRENTRKMGAGQKEIRQEGDKFTNATKADGKITNATDTDKQGLQGCEVKGSTKRSGEEQYQQPPGCVRPDWKEFPTKPPVCGGDDGLPRKLDGITFPKWRNESVKAYGNAIVPQVAYQIFKAINEYEKIKQ